MALQLGALRDALTDAGTKPEEAAAAAEEVVGHQSRPTHNRLAPLAAPVWAAIGTLVVLLGSQAALWARMGEISGQLVQVARAVTH